MKISNNKCIKIVSYSFVVLFTLMTVWIAFLSIFGKKKIENNSYNKRIDSWSENVVRGSILSADGDALAVTEYDENGEEKRVYPYENLFSHVVGYNIYGKSGLERDFNYYLLSSSDNELAMAINTLSDKKSTGYNVWTTLDVAVQQAASDAIGDSKGACVVLDATTGEVLCEVSKPDFNPQTLDTDWDSIVNDPESTVLLNRATNGLYSPGSTFKLVTLLEYMRENPDYDKFEYLCEGTTVYNNIHMSCIYGSAHGNVNLHRAFAYSCNCAFSHIGLGLDMKQYRKLCEELMFNSDLFTSFECAKSSFALDSSSSDFDIMQTSIGQGKTLMTPMHNALIMSAIANDGVLVKPHFLSKVTDGDEVVYSYKNETKRLLQQEECENVLTYLRDVVTMGTASNLNNDNYTVYGKTGSAQFDDENPELYHSWFIGFAEIGGRKLVLTCVIENTYDGGNVGRNVAKKVFDSIYQMQN